MRGALQQRLVPRVWAVATSSSRRELRRLSSTTPPLYCRDCRRKGGRGLLSTSPHSSYSSTAAATAIHDPSIVRNVAVIAHVDHGKTTLVDQLIKTGLLDEEADAAAAAAAAAALDGSRALDSGALEKERGITIMSKTTRVDWGGHILNLVVTPGHSDFGGEVERVLSMVDGAVLVVDATEGVMSQTKFVVSRAIKQGLKFVVVLNKADRDTARLGGEVEDEIFDLLVAMDATDEQLDFPIIYASAKEGWCVEDTAHVDPSARKAALGPQGLDTGMSTLLRRVAEHVGPPCDAAAVSDEPFAFSVNSLSTDPFIGRLVTGKVCSGSIKAGAKVQVIKRSPDDEEDEDEPEGKAKAAAAAEKATGLVQTVSHIFCIRNGTERVEIAEAQAGDIVVLAGVGNGDAANVAVAVADTVADLAVTAPLPTVPVTPPTICMSFGANDGPLAGRSGGTFLNSSQVKSRLEKEVENNVTVVLKPSPTDSDQLEVHARGELQLGILIEEMRREGYELCVSPPRILTKKDRATGKTLEPVEEVTVDVDAEHAGTVIERLQGLRAPMEEYKEIGEGRVRLIFRVPSRLLMGVRAALRNDTHGSAVVNSIFAAYERPEGGDGGEVNDKGRLVATGAQGNATAYALNLIEARGTLFVAPGEEVYEGMVIGENSRPGDLDVNPTKAKKMSNVRSVTADEKVNLAPPRQMSLEDYITYMAQDEVLEVTPKAIRLRKRFLDPGMRARGARSKKDKVKGSKK